MGVGGAIIIWVHWAGWHGRSLCSNLILLLVELLSGLALNMLGPLPLLLHVGRIPVGKMGIWMCSWFLIGCGSYGCWGVGCGPLGHWGFGVRCGPWLQYQHWCWHWLGLLGLITRDVGVHHTCGTLSAMGLVAKLWWFLGDLTLLMGQQVLPLHQPQPGAALAGCHDMAGSMR